MGRGLLSACPLRGLSPCTRHSGVLYPAAGFQGAAVVSPGQSETWQPPAPATRGPRPTPNPKVHFSSVASAELAPGRGSGVPAACLLPPAVVTLTVPSQHLPLRQAPPGPEVWSPQTHCVNSGNRSPTWTAACPPVRPPRRIRLHLGSSIPPPFTFSAPLLGLLGKARHPTAQWGASTPTPQTQGAGGPSLGAVGCLRTALVLTGPEGFARTGHAGGAWGSPLLSNAPFHREASTSPSLALRETRPGLIGKTRQSWPKSSLCFPPSILSWPTGKIAPSPGTPIRQIKVEVPSRVSPESRRLLTGARVPARALR